MKLSLRRIHKTTNTIDSLQPSDELVSIWALRLVIQGKIGIPTDHTSASNFLALVGPFLKWTEFLSTRIIQLTNDKQMQHAAAEMAEFSDIPAFLCKTNNDWEELGQPFAKLYLDQPKAVRNMLVLTLKRLENSKIKNNGSIEINVVLLGELLGLNELQKNLLLYAAYIKENTRFSEHMERSRIRSNDKAYRMLACMLETTPNDISRAIRPKSELTINGLIEVDYDPRDMTEIVKLNENIRQLIHQPFSSINELMQTMLQESIPAALEIDDYPHLSSDLSLIETYLTNAMAQGLPGVNILLYGKPGTGKTEFARLIAKQIGANCIEVKSADEDGDAANDRERYMSYTLAQKFLGKQSNNLILFDEAEDVFPVDSNAIISKLFGGRGNRSSSRGGKAWVNNLLETNPVPAIWITNETHQIDPAYLRRFSYHVEFQSPPRAIKKRITIKHLDGLPISEQLITELAENEEITPAQLENAVKLAKCSKISGVAEFERLIRQSIHQSMKVLGQKKTTTKQKSVTSYNLDYLNMDSRFPIPRIIESLRTKPSATLCFYGHPGTGKTMLAEHISSAIDKPLIIKRASDILSKWVGEAEKNIADMFRQAEDEEAILLLDEADSFLRDRKLAQKSWEVSQVNELLQGMERFHGIFICTTNLFESLDEAALRRFAFKIRFNYLTQEQNWNMFVKEMDNMGMDAGASPEAVKQKLLGLTNLTPGDYAVVKRQTTLMNETLTAAEMLSALDKESCAKPGVRKTGMGFVG